MLRLSDIAAAAAATGMLPLDDFRFLTHFRGNRNKHLADLNAFDSRSRKYLERRTPLPLDAIVSGDYLTLGWYGHEPWALLEEHESLDELERAILSGYGILNCWTDFLLAFIDGKQRSYEVREILADKTAGRLLVQNGVRVIEIGACWPLPLAQLFWTDG